MYTLLIVIFATDFLRCLQVTAGRLPHCDGPQVPPDDVKMLSSLGSPRFEGTSQSIKKNDLPSLKLTVRP